MVDLEPVINGDAETLYNLILCHAQYTDSKRGWDILACWEEMLPMFVKVMPRDYKRVLQERRLHDEEMESLVHDDDTASLKALQQ